MPYHHDLEIDICLPCSMYPSSKSNHAAVIALCHYQCHFQPLSAREAESGGALGWNFSIVAEKLCQSNKLANAQSVHSVIETVMDVVALVVISTQGAKARSIFSVALTVVSTNLWRGLSSANFLPTIYTLTAIHPHGLREYERLITTQSLRNQ